MLTGQGMGVISHPCGYSAGLSPACRLGPLCLLEGLGHHPASGYHRKEQSRVPFSPCRPGGAVCQGASSWGRENAVTALQDDDREL